MAKILVVAEQYLGQLRVATLSAVSAAKQYAEKNGGDFAILVLGSNVGGVADQLVEYGAAKVIVADAPVLERYLAESYAAVVADVAKAEGASLVLATSTTTGKDLLPRVAARLGAGMASDISGIVAANQFTRPTFAGNVISTVEVATPTIVASVRGTAFSAAEKSGGASAKETANVAVDAGSLKTKFVSFDETKSERPGLTEAKIVVSGGRGTKGDFKPIEQLADALGAAMGASRAAVDAGWVPNDMQVGQTGKIVAPSLYIAAGISGAIQHWAGMKDSKVIVAINKDGEAPIFQGADYGLIGDLFKVIPELVDELKKAGVAV
jgi:electron transfer flavoprotein alpha subunit